MTDQSGTVVTLATALGVIGVSAAISGLSNAIATACSGGSLEDCLLAGLAGAAGGAVGAVIGVVTGFSPLGGTLGRGAATIITDLATSRLLNGKLTKEDIAWAAVDATMDMTLSTITYYYNPIPTPKTTSDWLKQTAINVSIDGGMDIAQTHLFINNSNVQNQTATNRKSPQDYAHRKVGLLLGIIT